MNNDAELAAWRRHWHAGGESADTPEWGGLKEQVSRQTRRMYIGLIAPVLITAGIGGHLVFKAVSSGSLTDVLLAVEGWLFILLVWAGCLWAARGTWRPLRQTTSAFLDLAIRGCQSTITVVRLGLWFYIAQLVTVCILVPVIEKSPIRAVPILTSLPVILIGWIGLPVYVVWMVRLSRQQRGKLRLLFELKRQLAELDR